ncbi:hypothetical protein Gpo141_00005228 [Globisporangium polare]
MRNQSALNNSRAAPRFVLHYCVYIAVLLISRVHAAETCMFVVSPGDAGVGIAVFTDAACPTAGGVGCFGGSSVCRYCKNRSTPQSQNFIDCPTNAKASTPAPAPTPQLTPAQTPVPAQTPAPAPVTPVVSSSMSGPRCSQSVSPGDAGVGINIVTDASCANGGLGCIDKLCRYCKLRETMQSSTYLNCSSITGSSPAPSSASAFPVVAPSTPAPAPGGGATTAVKTPQADFCSNALATNALAATGIWALFDPSCPQDGDLGDCNTFCRMCKFAETSASASLRTCTSVLASTAGTTAAAVVQAATPPANQCTTTLSQDSVNAGIWMKLTCITSSGGMCTQAQCTYCKYFESLASAGYASCDDPIPSFSDA